jgi:hypothetical protein
VVLWALGDGGHAPTTGDHSDEELLAISPMRVLRCGARRRICYDRFDHRRDDEGERDGA